MSFIQELKRRNVLRIGAAYIFTAWLIVQVVETLFPVYGLSDEAIRMVVNVLAAGLVPVLVLTWVFEWTPEGLKRDSQVAQSEPPSQASTRRFDGMIIVMLVLALSYFVLEKIIVKPPPAESREASIAVLAFEDMSPDKDQEYLSDGISEEILNLLARIPEIRVISRSSAFSYKGSNTPITQIAEELDVAHVLEGSVRKVGERLRITAQLIEGRSDTHLWSRSFDRDLGDVFAIQDEIAAAMVNQMTISLLGDVPKSSRVDPEAYLLTLRGQHFLNLQQMENAIPYFKEATEIQPDYAEAWLGLYQGYWLSSSTRNVGLSIQPEWDEFAVLAHKAWDRAAQLDPDHPRIAAEHAFDTLKQGDYVQAARQLERALELHPRHWEVVSLAMNFALRVTRQTGIAKTLGAGAVARDPFCADCRLRYAQILMADRDYAAAILEMNQLRSILPGPGGEITIGTAKLMSGDPEGALEQFQSRVWDESQQEWGRLIVRITTGDLDGIEAELAEFESRFWSVEIEWANKQSSQQLAELYASLGDVENGFKWLAEHERNSEPWSLAGLWKNPFLVNLHDDPRWRAFEARIGVAPEQLAEIHFDPPLQVQSTP